MARTSKTSTLLLIVFFTCLLFGCKSTLDKKVDSIMESLELKENLSDIQIMEIYKTDSIFPCAGDTSVINLTRTLHKSVIELENIMEHFISQLPDNTHRIWIKTMTPEQADSYDNYDKAYSSASRAMQTFLYNSNSFRFGSKKNENHLIVKVEASKGNTVNDYLGIFYFENQNEPSNITKYYLFPINEALGLSSLYTQSVQNGQLPTLYMKGIDVVPEDEDPTKTREERAEIKQRQRQQEENKKIDSEITTGLREFINDMNKGGATQIDEMTTFIKSSFNGHVITAYYNLLADKNDYSSYQWEAFGSMMEQSIKEQCQNVLQYFVTNGTPKYKVKEAFNRLGIKWNYVYRDYRGRNLFTITVTPDDLN